MTFANQILQFNEELAHKTFHLPGGFKVINPYKGNQKQQVKEITTAFYQKYYNDIKPRRIILGSSPARKGSAVTGVPFEDAKHLQSETNIFIDEFYINKSSSGFLYDVINNYGGCEKFYADFYMNFVFPLGLARTNSKGNEVNCNYYENKQVELEGQAQDKSSNEGLPEEVNATIEGFVEAEYTYTNTQERAENILPFITAEMVPYFQQGETTSDSKNVVKVQSNLTKQEIGHYFLEGEKCQVTVRVLSTFQVDKQKKNESQVLLDLELVRDDTGRWLVTTQEIATIN